MLRAYYAEEKWTRLRVVAWPDNHNGQLIERAMLTLTPLKQNSPLLDPNDPRMLDPVMGQILGDYQSLRYYGRLHNPCFRCDILEIASHVLGQRVKYLLRCSNDAYPELLTNIPEPPDLHTEDEYGLERLQSPASPFFEVQAYDEQMIIAQDTPIGAPEYWPAGYATKREISFDNYHSWWVADSISLPITVDDEHLGRLLQQVWMANARFPYPPPSGLVDFWQRIAD
jgi:hypothetical protein